jgi:hypothetical protein
MRNVVYLIPEFKKFSKSIIFYPRENSYIYFILDYNYYYAINGSKIHILLKVSACLINAEGCSYIRYKMQKRYQCAINETPKTLR